MFRLEVSCILCKRIITAVAADDLIAILLRKENASYVAILFILPIYVGFVTFYRLPEMAVNTNFRCEAFFFVWPLSGVSLAPAFRRYRTSCMFDPLRTLPLMASATAIAAIGRGALRLSGAMRSMLMEIGMRAVAAVLLLGSVAALKVLRPSEHEAMVTTFPERFGPALVITRIAVRV